MKFNAVVAEVHAAARVKGPEAANVDNKVCIEAFQQLLSNSPWTQKIAFSVFSQQSSDILKTCCRSRAHMHTLFSGKGKYSC